MRSPSDEARGGQFLDDCELLGGEWLNGVLFGVWCDDFEIATFAEREKSIACAAARMDSTKRGAEFAKPVPLLFQ